MTADLKSAIHTIFGVTEAHELPAALLDTVLDYKALDKAKKRYKKHFPDLNHDYLRDYFQEMMADKKGLKQDYTPDEVCDIVADIAGKGDIIEDICAGTGSLTVALWKRQAATHYICCEASSAVLPFLLFNLAVREISATVIFGNYLKRECTEAYKVTDSYVEKARDLPHHRADAIVMNPPYSMAWEPEDKYRVKPYPLPPKSKADYAFLLTALPQLAHGGRLVCIYPHGVLFRGAQEAEIRKKLILNDCLRAVIGLPPALFSSTSIPVCLMVIQKKYAPTLAHSKTLIMDASKLYTKCPKQNRLEPEHVKKICDTYHDFKDVDKLARVVGLQELEKNDFNLNIPRYVDTSEPQEARDADEILMEIMEIDGDIMKTRAEFLRYLLNLAATDEESRTLLAIAQRQARKWAKSSL